jgi:hypothetical protein
MLPLHAARIGCGGSTLNFPVTGAEASAQAAGYLYQLRYALYRALKRKLRDPTGVIAIECIDDVVVSSENTVAEIGQLKHTTKSDVVFTDASPSVWRTLGNWSRYIPENSDFNLAVIELFFVTNASVQAGSGIALLAVDEEDRDVPGALTKLADAALKSKNHATKSDRDSFLELNEPVRTALIKAIRIVSGAPGLDALANEIEDLLHYACETSMLPEFRSELEGWWFEKVAKSFDGGAGFKIQLLELDARVSFLREKYKPSVLNIDVESPTENPDSLDAYTFSRQVIAVGAGEQRLRNAQRNFLKASAQRSKWLREARIDPAELDKYDNKLEERWQAQSAAIFDELRGECTDELMCKSGRQILKWAETQETPLRGASAQFLTSGSYHTLADRLKVGWHPNFKKLFGN